METYLTDAEIWELLIPNLGIFALARNIRNFDQAGVSSTIKDLVCAKFEDPEVIAKSRMFPYRFLSAYKAAPSLDWGKALEKALDLSCKNVPELPGRTLILIDTSASMGKDVSDRSQVKLYEIGALFAAVLAKRNPGASETVIFGDSSASFNVKPGDSVLRYVNRVSKANGSVGHGTAIWQAVVESYSGQDRAVIFTDMQTMDTAGKPIDNLYSYYGSRSASPRRSYVADVKKIPFIHGFNLAGYTVTTIPPGQGRFEYGGFTDSSFQLMVELERFNS